MFRLPLEISSKACLVPSPSFNAPFHMVGILYPSPEAEACTAEFRDTHVGLDEQHAGRRQVGARGNSWLLCLPDQSKIA